MSNGRASLLFHSFTFAVTLPCFVGTQVWASGFSAAIMKKHSVAAKGVKPNDARPDVLVVESNKDHPKPAVSEAILLSALEKLFDVVLNYPAINR